MNSSPQFIQKWYQSLLYNEAAWFRGRYRGPVIAITGSVGKTGTKEAVGGLVRVAYGSNVIVTPKSLNTEIGVPLTLLGFSHQPTNILGWLLAPFRGFLVALLGRLPRCIVVELGADHPGDIAYLSRLVKPTIAIITQVSESHSAYLGDLPTIQKEKASLLQFLSFDGTAILNGDDAFLATLKTRPSQDRLLARLGGRADYFTSNIKVGLHGTEAIVHRGNRTHRIKIDRFGGYHFLSVLFTLAVGDVLKIPQAQQLEAVKNIKPLAGRGTLIDGKKGSYILDESYNAQPAAMEASLRLLAELPANRKVAVVGDMRELKDPAKVHQTMGKLVRQVADYSIAVGPSSRDYRADEWFATAEEAVPSILKQLGPGVIVLVKGSQNTIRLERVVKELMAHPEQAPRLLVRQEPEWLAKP